MLDKKSQVTIFMILGIILLLSLLVLVYFKVIVTDKSSEIEKTTTQQFSDDPIKFYIERCIENTAKKGVFLIAEHGGYISPSGIAKYNESGDTEGFYNYYYFENKKLPYALDDGIIKLRPKKDIENVLSNYIKVELNTCLENFSFFKKQGFVFEYPELDLTTKGSNVSVLIGDSNVFVNVNWPLTIKKGNYKANLHEFGSSIDLRFGLLYSMAQRLVADASRQQPFDVAGKCRDYLPKDNLVNLYLESNTYTYQYVIRIIDIQSLIKWDLPLKFQFAVKNMELYGECVG